MVSRIVALPFSAASSGFVNSLQAMQLPFFEAKNAHLPSNFIL